MSNAMTTLPFVHLTKLDGRRTTIMKAHIFMCSESPDHPPGARVRFKQASDFVDVTETMDEIEALLGFEIARGRHPQSFVKE